MVIECHECRGTVSTEARTCPHCGAPVSPKAQPSVPPLEPVATPQSGRSRGRRTLDRLAMLFLALTIVGVAGWLYLGASGRQVAQQAAQNVLGAEQTIVDETFDIPSGAYRTQGVRLPSASRVTVRLTVREGSAVDFYLMTPQEVAEFQQVSQKTFGGQYHYSQQLSHRSVQDFSDGALLPPGEWHFLIRSTDQALLLGNRPATRVYLKVTAQR